jgi:anhydro-N-acetylmuramic acid kinase
MPSKSRLNKESTSQPTRLIAGAMSGTSADGIDVVIARIQGSPLNIAAHVLLHHHQPYDSALRSNIFTLREGEMFSLRVLMQLNRDVSLAYASAINEALLKAKLNSADLTGIAAHGQTLFHEPPLTLQWLDPALLAARVGCDVISDFRRADCAVGGQGAPLVPYADYLLFRHPNRARILLNIGGIANLTFLPASPSFEQIVAFDTGPGNCVSDWLMRQFDPTGAGYDADGTRASRGRVLESSILRIRQHPYFSQRHPKSTDGPAMISAFIPGFDHPLIQYSLDDLLATACYLTAKTICDAISTLPTRPDELIISGGGTQNPVIMRNMSELLPDVPVLTADNFGIDQAAKEALAFALLGAATLDRVPANVPTVTGATRAVILGSITPYTKPT